MSKKISIVVPVFNEAGNIEIFFSKLKEVLFGWLNYDYEIIFVDDGSIDNSIEVLEKIALQDDKVKFLEFSRNFGKENALSAGLEYASGDAVLMIDGDLQHPIELIPEFIKKWERGADVVIGVREKNQGEGLLKKIGSWWFYKIMNHIGETKITPHATDFRLLDRKVVEEFKRFKEKSRLTRGLIDWLGFKRDYIYFEANKRVNGQAGYGGLKLFRLALSSFVAHSLLPLKIAGYLGLLIIVTAGPWGLYVFLGMYVFHWNYPSNFSGPAQLAILLIFLVGIILSCLGLIALYVANIREEVLDRPLYVIRRKKI